VDYYNIYAFFLKGDQVFETGIVAAQGAAPDFHHYRRAGHSYFQFLHPCL
jgi:hypothetical protein